MTDREINVNPHFLRGKWMLEHQISGPDDMIRFWAVFGQYAV